MKNDFAKNFLEILKKLFCQKILKNSKKLFYQKNFKKLFYHKNIKKLKKIILQKIFFKISGCVNS